MARYNEIQVGRFNRFLQKLLSMKGPASLSQLAPELQLVISAWSGVEDRYLQGWETFGSTFSQAAVAASAGGVRLRNPSGSGMVAVIVAAIGHGDGLSAYTMGLQHQVQPVDLGTIIPLTGAALDPRGRPQPTMIASSASPATAQTGLFEKQAPTSVSVDFINYEDQSVMVLPGTAVQIQMTDLNKAMSASFMWRERTLEDSEKT